MVPALQQEYDELMAELAKEKGEVAELEGCDQDYLNELKATIAEQRYIFMLLRPLLVVFTKLQCGAGHIPC